MCNQYIFMAILSLVILPLLFPGTITERGSTILIIATCLGGLSGVLQKYVC